MHTLLGSPTIFFITINQPTALALVLALALSLALALAHALTHSFTHFICSLKSELAVCIFIYNIFGLSSSTLMVMLIYVER